MTPKEKAKELIQKFYPNVQWKLGQEDCLDRAKRCALIAVDEIITSLDYDYIGFDRQKKYYLEVKQEIELL
jgi:hypothetical protein